MNRMIVYALIALGVFFAGVATGWRHEAVKFDQFKAAVQAEADAQAAKTKEIEKRHDDETRKAADSYNRRIADLRAYYAARVPGGSGGGQVPRPADPAGGANGYTPDHLPDPAILASQCAETTLMLTSLQDWVSDVTKEN